MQSPAVARNRPFDASRPFHRLPNGASSLLQRSAAATPTAKCAAAKKAANKVEYGTNWYEQTRAASSSPRTVREEIAYRKEANRLANNGKERKDLYTDNWDGSEYKGSRWNILTVLAALFFLVPVGGLLFAWQSYGVLWG